MATLLSGEDLAILQDIVVHYFDILKMHVQRVLERLIPERLTTFFTASAFIASLLLQDISDEKKQTLKLLSEVFAYDL